MTLGAGGFHEFCRQYRLVPMLNIAMCFFYFCCRSLSAVTDRTAKFFYVVMHVRVRAERLRRIFESIYFHSEMTRRTTVNTVEILHPVLLYADLDWHNSYG